MVIMYEVLCICQQIQITGFEDGDVFFFLSSGDALRFFFFVFSPAVSESLNLGCRKLSL